jgi:hypothetical protein
MHSLAFDEKHKEFHLTARNEIDHLVLIAARIYIRLSFNLHGTFNVSCNVSCCSDRAIAV